MKGQLNQILRPFIACSAAQLIYLRLAVGILTLFSMIGMVQLIPDFYGPSGHPVCSLSTRIALGLGHWMSVLCLVKVPALAFCLGLLGILCSVGLTLGIQTRIMNIACWLIHLTFMSRSPLSIYGADFLLAVILFWGIFLPWKNSSKNHRALPLLPLFFFKMQIFLMYVVTFMVKTGDGWLGNFSATIRILANERYASGLGDFLIQMPNLCKLITISTLLLELLAGFLLFFPIHTTYGRIIRWAGLIGLCLFHVSVFLTLNIGIFQPLALATLIPFIPVKEKEWAPTVLTERPSRDLALTIVQFLLVFSYTPFRLGNLRILLSTFFLNPPWMMMAPDTPNRRVAFQYFGISKDGSRTQLEKYSEPLERNERREYFRTKSIRWRELHTKDVFVYKGRCLFTNSLCQVEPYDKIEQVIYKEHFRSHKSRLQTICSIKCNSL